MKKGLVCVFPTDTVYGIGCLYDDEEGMQKIYEIKHRSVDKKLPVLFSNLDQMDDLIEMSESIKKLAKAFWPGGLTMIVKTKPKVYLKTKESTWAIRMPNHLEVLLLLQAVGPMRVTSLNESGKPPLVSMDQVYQAYQNKVDIIYPFKDQNISKVASTIVDMTDEPMIIRQGDITLEEIHQALV